MTGDSTLNPKEKSIFSLVDDSKFRGFEYERGFSVVLAHPCKAVRLFFQSTV
jgi:hypothetical protein